MWNYGRLFLPRETMAYAIIKTGGRQFRVAEGDKDDVDILDVGAGKTATFGDVLMFADGKNVTQGNPVIAGAKVTAEVLEQRKDKKVIAFKYKRRKGYHRTVGHRRKLTRVKIATISVGTKKSKKAYKQPTINKKHARSTRNKGTQKRTGQRQKRARQCQQAFRRKK